MSFRKRNAVIRSAGSEPIPRMERMLAGGTRPSPLDGRLTTSTGTASLDKILAGHGGLAVGNSLLVEEVGTTDFGGILLRYFTAEGLIQGHHVHVLGADENWRRDLPGLGQSERSASSSKDQGVPDPAMKIAWRYEKLGNTPTGRGPESRQRTVREDSEIFCHSFDLSKRLDANSIRGQLLTVNLTQANGSTKHSCFANFISGLRSKLQTSPESAVHRVVLPNLLAPTIYPSAACRPHEVLHFLHSLRSLLRQYPTQITVIGTLPISLHPRASGLCRWIELLFDGVIELIPLQQQQWQQAVEKGDGGTKEQGLLRIHSLPIFHEKGGGANDSWRKEDMSFRLSASSGLLITPFSLPPLGLEENESTGQPQEMKSQDLDF